MRGNTEWQRIGATVRTLRELRGLTADELATHPLVNMSRSHLSNIEAGRKPLSALKAAKIAAVLQVRQIAILNPDEFAAAEAVAA